MATSEWPLLALNVTGGVGVTASDVTPPGHHVLTSEEQAEFRAAERVIAAGMLINR